MTASSWLVALRRGLLRGIAGSLALSQLATAQASNSGPFVTWARPRAQPLSQTATGSESDMRAFDPIVGNARVVAFGEPTHGAHEPLVMRNRLIRYLVEQKGFTAVALETSFNESATAHALVLGGSGDIARTVHTTFSWGFGNFPENIELITWLKQWNANPAHRRKVNFYGIDLTGGSDDAFKYASRSVTTALAWLDRNDPKAAAALHKRLDTLMPHFADGDYMSLSTLERQVLRSSLMMLDTTLARHRDAHAESDDYQWAARSAKVALQLDQMLAATPPPQPMRGLPPEAFRQMNIRDSSMAANLRWVLDREGAGGKVVVFAHNQHIQNAKVAGGMWSTLRVAPAAMGTHLRRSLGNDLVLIGSSAAATADGLPPMENNPASFDAVLATLGKPRFVLDLRPGRSVAGVGSWLNETRPLHSNLSSFALLAPGTAFDAVVFFQSLTPSR